MATGFKDGSMRNNIKSRFTRITFASMSNGLEGKNLRQRVVSRVGK